MQGVLGVSNYTAGVDLSPYMAWATLIVDRVAVCASSKGQALTDDELEMVERWLSAHAYKQSDRAYDSKKTGKASATFSGKTGMFLQSSMWGQNALLADPSGCLKAIDAAMTKGKADIIWLGKTASEDLDWDQRN